MELLLLMVITNLLASNTVFCAEINKEESDTFHLLRTNYHQFKKNHCHPFPSVLRDFEDIDNSPDNYRIKKFANFAQTTHPILDNKVKQLCLDFIIFKQQHGSSIEKNLYKDMSLSSFIIRLLEKRPLVFIDAQATLESTRLRNNPHQTAPLDLDFTHIGTPQEKPPLILQEYLSYDEMKIAALIGISGPTFFINNGGRSNGGVESFEYFFQHEGIYIGLVGARFEKPNKMEWQDILITKEQNTKENGYGLAQCNTGLLKVWSDFYDCKFPTYEEAKNSPKDHPHKYIPLDQKYFNMEVYKKRIECVIKPFLWEANRCGEDEKKEVYIHAVGLGTGTWAIHKKMQEKAMIKVYKKIIEKNDFSWITNINFSWFGKEAIQSFTKSDDILKWKDQKKNSISIQFSQRNPADKLAGKNSKKLLVASYPWDGNAYPGNEYWLYELTTSGDPAAAACSYIAVLQNPLINPYIKENILQAYPSHS